MKLTKQRTTFPARGPYPTAFVDGDAHEDARIGGVLIGQSIQVSGEAVFGDGLHLNFIVLAPGTRKACKTC